MKFIILAFALFAVAVADVSVLRSESVVNPDSYSFNYELDNGIIAGEEGKLKDAETIVARGQFAYKSPEGETVQVSYSADENGFQPTGSHIPTPPPVPGLIQRALQYIAAHPSKA